MMPWHSGNCVNRDLALPAFSAIFKLDVRVEWFTIYRFHNYGQNWVPCFIRVAHDNDLNLLFKHCTLSFVNRNFFANEGR